MRFCVMVLWQRSCAATQGATTTPSPQPHGPPKPNHTHTDQPACAVCKKPCIDEVETVEVIPGPMPTKPASYAPAAGRIQSTTFAQNQGANAQQVTVAFAFAQQLSSSMKFGNKFTYQEKAKVKLGLPFFSEAGARGGMGACC